MGSPGAQGRGWERPCSWLPGSLLAKPHSRAQQLQRPSRGSLRASPVACLLPPPLPAHAPRGAHTQAQPACLHASHRHKRCHALRHRNAHPCIPVLTRAHGHPTGTHSNTHANTQTYQHGALRTDIKPPTARTSTNAQPRSRPDPGGPQAGAPCPAHLPAVGPEGEAALPAAHGAAAAAAARRARAACPAPGSPWQRGRPAPGHKPGDCPRPRGLRSSCGGRPRAERAACSRRPRAGGRGFAGLSELGREQGGRGTKGGGSQGARAGPQRLQRGASRTKPTLHPQTGGVRGCRPSSIPPRALGLCRRICPPSSRSGVLTAGRVKNLESRVPMGCTVGKSLPSVHPELLLCEMELIHTLAQGPCSDGVTHGEGSARAWHTVNVQLMPAARAPLPSEARLLKQVTEGWKEPRLPQPLCCPLSSPSPRSPPVAQVRRRTKAAGVEMPHPLLKNSSSLLLSVSNLPRGNWPLSPKAGHTFTQQTL